MSLDRAKNHLKKYGLDKNIIEFEESTATVKEAALALGTSESQIAKTLALYVGDRALIIVTKGDAKIDNAKFKAEFGKKGSMIPLEDLEVKIGHPAGGVCPFGIENGVDVYLDNSLKEFDVVYPAAGTAQSAVKLSIPELEQSTNYKRWVDVTK